jgi:hypothetical protein
LRFRAYHGKLRRLVTGAPGLEVGRRHGRELDVDGHRAFVAARTRGGLQLLGVEGFGVCRGLGFRVLGLGFGVQGLMFRVESFGFGGKGLGFRV